MQIKDTKPATIKKPTQQNYTSAQKSNTYNQWSKPGQSFFDKNKKSTTYIKSNTQNQNNISKTKNQSFLNVFINDQIKAFTINVIDENGESLWEMSRYDALNMSRSKWLDLMQINYDKDKRVCTAKILDYGKYMYEKKRKEKESKLKQKQSSKDMKEVKFSYGISENDMKRKLDQVRQRLQEWHPIKLTAEVKGRERNFKDRIIDNIKKISDSLSDCSRFQFQNPKEEKNDIIWC